MEEQHNDCLRRITDLEARVSVAETLISERHVAADRARRLASEAVDKRLENMNEFREQLNRQASTFTTKTEHADLLHLLETVRIGLGQADDVQEKEIGMLRAELAGLTARFWIGGTGIVLMLALVQIGVDYVTRH